MDSDVIEQARRLMQEQMEIVAEQNERSPVIPSIKLDPILAAVTLLDRYFAIDGRYRFIYWRECWYVYYQRIWEQRTEQDVTMFLHEKLSQCRTVGKDGSLIAFPCSRENVGEILFQVKQIVTLPSHFRAPAFKDNDGRWKEVDATGKMVCKGSVVNMLTGESSSNKYLFIPNGAQWEYNQQAAEPERWLSFLQSLEMDAQSVSMLQEWMGYLLSGDSWAQKGMIIIGPPRSGKGTIGHVVRELLGDSMVSSPTLNYIASQFGLEGLIDKRLCLISDARLSNRADMLAVVEILLRVIAQDSVTIVRKFKGTVESQLPCRVMMLSNMMPALADDSDAISTRFILMNLHKSFLGKEDISLKSGLMNELPGIALWCIEGYRRLVERGRFDEPDVSQRKRQEWYRDANPVLDFVDKHIRLESAAQTSFRDIYKAFCTWSEDFGHPSISANMLSRRLSAHFGTKVYRSKNSSNDVVFVGLKLAGGTF